MTKIFIDACCGLSGGGYDYAVEILQRVDSRAKVVCFVESARSGETVGVYKKTGNVSFRVRRGIFGYKGIEDLWRLFILPLHVLRSSPDVFVSFSGIVSPLIFQPKKITLIHNILPFHDLAGSGWSVVERLILLVRKTLLIASIYDCDRILTFSEDAAQKITRFARNKQISFILHSSKFIASNIEKSGLRSDAKDQLSVFINSSCMPHKNLEVAVKGVILLLARIGKPVSLRIAGNLENTRYRERFAKFCQKFESVDHLTLELLGYLESRELATVAEIADVCISPSLIEIFDIGCLDNLYLCGRVCVSDTSVHREVFEGCEGVQFFDSLEPLSLVQALETALAGSPCTREAILNRFGTWDDVANKTWRLINE